MLHHYSRIVLFALAATAFLAACPMTAEEPKEQQPIRIQIGRVEEADAKAELSAPNFGYVGDLGTFIVTKNGDAQATIVVHQYPKTEVKALGQTKLIYEGTKRLGNVDGWVYKTEWDGKTYPSKIFFSSSKVYFGGGINSYIAADYRDETGWAWKMLPLRRMENLNKTAGSE